MKHYSVILCLFLLLGMIQPAASSDENGVRCFPCEEDEDGQPYCEEGEKMVFTTDKECYCTSFSHKPKQGLSDSFLYVYGSENPTIECRIRIITPEELRNNPELLNNGSIGLADGPAGTADLQRSNELE